MAMNTYRISGNSVVKLIIVYLLRLRCPYYTQVFCKYVWRWHGNFSTPL